MTGRKCKITIEAFSGEPDETPATISATLQPDENGEPRIVELTVRASAGVELPAKVALGIDFDAIARALSGAVEAIPLAVEAGSSEEDRHEEPLRAKHGQERPYRKMPEADEVVEVFQRGGESVGKLAAHYDVPRYTAQAWVNRLRRLGHLENGSHAPVA